MIVGMPGIAGSLGTCQVCGKSFVTEVLTGQSVSVVGHPSFEDDMAVHEKCKKTLMACGSDWGRLPEGPIRTCFATQVKTT